MSEPILYTDGIFVQETNVGLTLSFAQSTPQHAAEERIVARIGMSPEYAKQLVRNIREALGSVKPKGADK